MSTGIGLDRSNTSEMHLSVHYGRAATSAPDLLVAAGWGAWGCATGAGIHQPRTSHAIKVGNSGLYILSEGHPNRYIGAIVPL